MAKTKKRAWRDQARKWTCNQFAITDKRGDAVKLLRKVADSIKELGEVELLDIVYQRPMVPSITEVTVIVYFSFPGE